MASLKEEPNGFVHDDAEIIKNLEPIIDDFISRSPQSVTSLKANPTSDALDTTVGNLLMGKELDDFQDRFGKGRMHDLVQALLIKRLSLSDDLKSVASETRERIRVVTN